MSGIAYFFRSIDLIDEFQIDDPESEIDGDLFWLWIKDTGVRIGFEEWEGQATACVKLLLERHPEFADAVVREDTLAFDPGSSLRDIVDCAPAAMRDIADVERWYHGTTSLSLQGIMEEGIHGNVSMEKRSWKMADVPLNTVYMAEDRSLALEYAHRAARVRGGDPVVIEISASGLDAKAICEDRDFLLMDESQAWKEGRYGACSAASASLTLTGKTGYYGVVPPEAISAILKTDDFVTWKRQAPFCAMDEIDEHVRGSSSYAKDELDGDWSVRSPEDLAEYAGQWEDMTSGALPEDLDWIYIADLPVAALWSKEEAKAYWDDQSLEAEENGVPGMWDGLIGLPVREPIVVGFYGRDDFSIWDGSHRSAAHALEDWPTIPSVIGIKKGLSLDELPELIRPVVAEKMAQLEADAASASMLH